MTAPSPRLPNELLDTVLERLFAVEGAERAAVCDALVAEHPQHGEALRQVFAQLGGAERLLARQFPFESGDVPAAIGGYGVQRVLGEGAFGSVYLCTQAQPVARQVAVKVLRPGAGDLHTLRRFAAERQLLATLRHPAITHFYDAGHLPDGRPYFVMEYVDGEPITSYCSKRNLNTAARLRLFVQLCHGVEYAHGRGVVHRDLKPSNVLVVETTGEPLPKIIDFGIAKALAATDSVVEGPATEAGRVLGTPGYMSPEQAAGRAELIDERSDVFALGVMLYELLTGELPWPRGEGIGDATPQLASQRLLAQAHADGAAQRHQAAHVRGDLDWITRKATHAERAERYASVRALADDLERHIAGRPVLAGPPSITYRLAKLAGRNRVATAAVAFAVLAAAGGLTLATWWGRTAEAGIKQATDEAKASFADAAAAVHKLLERAKDPELLRKPQSEGTRQALAADALAFYDQWLRTRPQDADLRGKRCEALLTLAEVHTVLGQYDDALRVSEQAATEAQSLVEARPASLDERGLLADANRKRYRALLWLRRYDDAHGCIQAALHDYEHLAARDRTRFGLAHGRALADLASSYTLLDRADESSAAVTRAIAALEELVQSGIAPAEARSELVRARYAQATAQVRVREFAAAERGLALVETELSALTEGRSRITAGVYHQQGRLAIFRGDLAGALPPLRRAVATSEAWHQQEPQQAQSAGMLHMALQDLATVQDKLGDFDAAGQTMRRIIEVGEERLASLPAGATFAAEQARALFLFARKLWNRVRRQDLALARTWLARAHALATETGDPPLWLIEGTQAMVAEADGDANDAQWDRLPQRLPATQSALPKPDWTAHVAEAWLGVARSRFRRRDLEGAAVALANAEQFLDDPATHDRFDYNYASEIAWWRARLSLSAGDVPGAAPHIARMLELRSSWWGRWRAGDCEREAWRLLARNEPTAPETRTHRDAAADHYRAAIDSLCELVAKDATDPWPVVPWGLAHLGLAEIALDRGERVAALGLLDVALPALATVEANAQCDTWDAARVAAARALHATLAAERPGR